MRTTTSMLALVLVMALLAASGPAVGAQGPDPQAAAGLVAPLGTAFTYQGRLTDGGSPADGAYDLSFALYDASSGGSQVGSTLTENDVPVTDGLFTVQLDFGSGAFTGEARFLEIGVRPGASGGAFTTLSPRQPLTAAPYALHAMNAWQLSGNGGTNPAANFLGTTDNQPLVVKTNGTEAMRVSTNGEVAVGTASPMADLHINGSFLAGVPPFSVSDYMFYSHPVSRLFVAAGTSDVEHQNMLLDFYSYRFGLVGSIGICNTGSPVTFCSGVPDNALALWNFGGAGITFMTGDSERMRVTNDGRVGIGTTGPTHKLEVVGINDSFRVGTDNSWLEVFTGGNSRLGLGDGAGNEAAFIAGGENSAGANTLTIAGCDDPGNCPVYTTFHESGNVGIGTDEPTARLEVVGSGDSLRVGSANSWLEVWTGGNSRLSLGDGDGNEAAFIAGGENSAGANTLTIAGCDDPGNCPAFTTFHENGNVGIGTTEPTERLEVNGNVHIQGNYTATGTKSSIAATDDGDRLLYAEEATEVWFADYGFGQLQNGTAVVPIDGVFAQTVNLDEPYHVFIQVYGNAEVYVSNRTASQFEVRLRDGVPDVEFSYRLVAKRAGYEEQRLRPAAKSTETGQLGQTVSNQPAGGGK